MTASTEAPYGSAEWEEKLRADQEKWAAQDRELLANIAALRHRADTLATLTVDNLHSPQELSAAVVDLAGVLAGVLELVHDGVVVDPTSVS